MPIKDIIEVEKTFFHEIKNRLQRRMDINVSLSIAENIPKRHGSKYVLCGSCVSGKTSLFLNMFKTKQLYKNKFYNIFYICPTV